MLSFSGKIHMRMNIQFLSSIINKITKSLQVPCSPLFYISRSYLPGKRVLPFTLREKMNKRLSGSISVEAACVLPMFVFFGLAILAPMKWLDTHRQMQTKAERLGEFMSQSAYTMEAGENENIHLEYHYRENIPFFFENICGISMCAAVKRRGWIGLDGKLTSQGVHGEESDQEMVYITPEGERYHSYRDCSYLQNLCKAVSMQELEYLRNNDGKIYYSCSQCVPNENIQDTVYITTWGVRYHNDRTCASMSNYFRKVPLAEVSDWGECSVCASRHD